MKRILLVVIMLLAAATFKVSAKSFGGSNALCSQNDSTLYFYTTIDTHSDKAHFPKSPVMQPSVSQDGHTLYLHSGCDNSTFCLFNEERTEYCTYYIEEGTSSFLIPLYLSGTYTLQIQRGCYIFTTELTLL